MKTRKPFLSESNLNLPLVYRTLGALLACAALLQAPAVSHSETDDPFAIFDQEPTSAQPAKPRAKSAGPKTKNRVPASGAKYKSSLQKEIEADSKIENEENLAVDENEPSSHVKEALARVDELMKQSKFDEVISSLKPMAESLPRKGLLTLARAYAAKKDHSNEIRTLDLALVKNARDYVVMTRLGEAYAKAKKSDEAIEKFLEAKTINRRYLPAYEALLAELERKADNYEARSLVQDMIQQFGERPTYFTALCRLFSKDAFLEKAVSVCEEAIKKDPKVPENYVHLGECLKDQEKLDRALSVLKDAGRRFPASEIVHKTKGDMHFAKRQFVEAHKSYKQATEADSKSVHSWLGYANSAFELYRNQEALTAFLKACELDRRETKDLRIAIDKLRKRNDSTWLSRFADGLSSCRS
jgi:tetratricopeptide (TPR) repeat protein